ncbi:hypothetical protein PUN28_010539 [Cardiocondyla obscurior]|uniref:Uncharacterized protein n=1 Tax=Cardiocondyla obscurior TaxID=286306 RepID=A0AAW2FJ41_9HYME
MGAAALGGKCRETGYDRRRQSAVKWKPELRHIINIWRELSVRVNLRHRCHRDFQTSNRWLTPRREMIDYLTKEQHFKVCLTYKYDKREIALSNKDYAQRCENREIAFNKHKRGLRIWANEFRRGGTLPRETKTHLRERRCCEDDERNCGEQVAYDNHMERLSALAFAKITHSETRELRYRRVDFLFKNCASFTPHRG